MSGTLDRYIPEFDEDEARTRLAGASAEELTDMLIYSYKLRPRNREDVGSGVQ
jgi:hypothetical protein